MSLGPQFGALEDRLKRDGGFSVDPRTGQSPSKGYMVAEYGSERIVPGYASADDIASHVEKVPQGAYLGAWHDGNATYLDASHNVATHGEAQRLGRQHAQRAVYSMKTGAAPAVKHAEHIGRQGTLFEGLPADEHKTLNRTNQEYARATTERRLTAESINGRAARRTTPSAAKQGRLF